MTFTRIPPDERRERIKHIQPYWEEVSVKLGLGDWDLRIMWEPPGDPEAEAAVERITGQKVARIYLADGFFDNDPEGQRNTVIHELLHCHLRPMWEGYGLMAVVLGRVEWEMFQRAMQNAEELAVDNISRGIGGRFGLPPVWGEAAAPPPEGGVVLPSRTRFPDGDELERTIVFPAESVRMLAEAVTAAQSAALAAPPERTAADKLEEAAGLMDDAIARAEEATALVAQAAEEAMPPEYVPEAAEVSAFDPAERPVKRGKAPRGMA